MTDTKKNTSSPPKKKKAKKNPDVHEMHVNIPKDSYADMKTIAEHLHHPVAWVLKMIVKDSLKEYMNYVHFTTPESEKEILSELKTMNNALSDIKFQIRSVGYNVNQISHDSHIAVKQMNEGKLPESAFVSDKEVRELSDSINSAMQKYEDVSNEVGQIAWQLYK